MISERHLRIGSDAHYVEEIREVGDLVTRCRTARVTEVPNVESDDEHTFAHLVVFGPAGVSFEQFVVYDENATRDTWHWPEPEDA